MILRDVKATDADKNKENNTKANNPKADETQETPRSLKDEFLDSIQPHINTAKDYYQKTNTQIESVVTPLKFHLNKARDAIKEVNAKLELQEKESENYGFNEDFTQQSTNHQKTKITGLPSDREKHRKKWTKKLELYIDSLQETIFTATRALNDVTGYSAIQKLRSSIEALENELQRSKEQCKTTKQAYNNAVNNRVETQKEVNELLKRKSNWSQTDLENFTKLYKADHENALLEEEAKINVEKAEVLEEELQDKLSKAILTRYHEEQIWSDKIRRTSTWGTFGLMGINILLFLVFQLALEPWKRRRLVGNFEERVQQALRDNSVQQNERLDIMSQKVEALKHSDRLPALRERQESEIDEEDTEVVEPPKIGTLPMPPSAPPTWLKKLEILFQRLIQPFTTPFNLLFYQHYEQATIHKSELVSITTVSVGLGLIIGSLGSTLLR
jgi:sensitive to high expression protein 9